MIRTGVVLILAAAIVTVSYGYDESLANLFTPSFVTAPSLQATFQHRFSRGIGESSHSLLGGAEVNTGVAGNVWKGLGVSLDYHVPADEVDLGCSYSLRAIGRLLSVYGAAHFFNFEEGPSQSRVSSSFFAAAVNVNPWQDRLWLVGNVVYDVYNISAIPSAGALMRIGEKLDLTAEYCFAHDTSLFNENSFSLGATFHTWRHHFRLLLANSTGNGGRHFPAGARDNRLRFGFSIQRLFDFT